MIEYAMKSDIMTMGVRAIYFGSEKAMGYAESLVGPSANVLATVYTVAYCCIAEEGIDSDFAYQVCISLLV
jgi:hypothetical protein